MEKVLPIFPLNLVVFPGESLNLHIFEDRYKDLIQDVIAGGERFGIPTVINGELGNYGTEVELVGIDRVYAEGELDVKTRGVRVFKVEEVIREFNNKKYSGAMVEWVEDHPDGDEVTKKKIIKLLKKLHSVLRISQDKIGDEATFSTFRVAHLVGFNLEQEYQFLTTVHESERQEIMLEHLTKVLPIAKETEALKERVQANGHFKNVLPPDF